MQAFYEQPFKYRSKMAWGDVLEVHPNLHFVNALCIEKMPRSLFSAVFFSMTKFELCITSRVQFMQDRFEKLGKGRRLPVHTQDTPPSAVEYNYAAFSE